MKHVKINDILNKLPIHTHLKVQGWILNKRISKHVAFIMLQDGSHQKPLQIVIDPTYYPTDFFTNITIGASIAVEGTIVTSQGKDQSKELQATSLTLLGKACAKTYPLQPKRHNTEFLRTIQHIRFRTNTFRAVTRLRHAISYALHQFFHKKDFYYIHTPIITSLDAEGAGELFVVNTREKKNQPFFNQPAYLTVSGQLTAEAAALALGQVYTFAPTFRAENSHTTRHLAEFWMVEPEMAFYDLDDSIHLAEEMMKYIFNYLLTNYRQELDFLTQHTNKPSTMHDQLDLVAQLQSLLKTPFARITYSRAFDILQKAIHKNPKEFVYPLDTWGIDLHTEHENHLVNHFQKPVIVTDYPKAIKPFYMRQNHDNKTVACMDILLPRVGEVIGGSQREERYEKLLQAIQNKHINPEPLAWYIDTRRFGTAIHSGFGLGLDRLVQFITGMDNIRDTIPFPRTPGHLAY